jgi:PhnB protein
MDQQVAPYINFQGHAREAMDFYQRVFGGQVDLYSAGEQGKPRPAEPGERIMHARLSSDGVLIVGSDGHPSYPVTVGDHMAVVLVGSDRERLSRAFDRLAEGGKVKMPLTDQPWGGAAGWLTDRFGINWNVDVEKG